MIRKITITNFKKFQSASYSVNPSTVSLFVGPNNGGKTTALQAIALWSFLIQKWNEKKGKSSKSKAKERHGAAITRNEIYAVPVQEMNLLWFNAVTQSASRQKIPIHIIAEGVDKNGKRWTYGVELKHHHPELAYCKPLDTNKDVPEDSNNVFHLPPLSGVQTQEKKVELGAQMHIIGEGRPGEILRNLLLQVQEKGAWEELNEQVKEMFHVQLEPIAFNSKSDAYILVYFRPERWRGKGQLEIANAGSGFLQFLLLAAFLYVHADSVLLIDEPDSHMHVRLQQGMYDWLQTVASRNGVQLLISTHSEVMINSTDTDDIYTFFGSTPQQIQGKKAEIIHALREVSAIEILDAQDKKFILFAEGNSDFRLLKNFANKLKHEVKAMLDNIFFIATGDNQIDKARNKFKQLRIIEPKLTSLFIRDKVPVTEQVPPGFDVVYWSRNEIENYLIVPSVLERFVEQNNRHGELFAEQDIETARKFLQDNLPPKVYKDPINNDIGSNGSDFLENFFRECKIDVNKGDYWRIVDVMDETNIHDDIRDILDKLFTIIKQVPIGEIDEEKD